MQYDNALTYSKEPVVFQKWPNHILLAYILILLSDLRPDTPGHLFYIGVSDIDEAVLFKNEGGHRNHFDLHTFLSINCDKIRRSN
jgi:hypothetical protein